MVKRSIQVNKIILVLFALWVRGGQEESQEFLENVVKAKQQPAKIPLFEAVRQNPKGFFYIIANNCIKFFHLKVG